MVANPGGTNLDPGGVPPVVEPTVDSSCNATGDATLSVVVPDGYATPRSPAPSSTSSRDEVVSDGERTTQVGAGVGGGLGGTPPLSPLGGPLAKSPTEHLLDGPTPPAKSPPPHVDVVAAHTPLARTSSLADKQLAVVQRIDDRLKRKAQRIVEGTAKAAYLDDNGLPVDGTRMANGVPEGWSAVAYNIAKDARKPLKQAPGYLGMMQRVHESYQRAAGGEKPAVELGADIRVYVQQNVFNYPVRDVTEKEKG